MFAVTEGVDELMTLLSVAMGEWRLLAVFLDVDTSRIDVDVTVDECMTKMIKKWIQTKGDDATIDAITEALASDVIANRLLARKIRENPKIKKTYYGMNRLNNSQQT